MKITMKIYIDILLTALRGRITPRMKITMKIYIDILLTALRGRITPRMKITMTNLYRHPVNRRSGYSEFYKAKYEKMKR